MHRFPPHPEQSDTFIIHQLILGIAMTRLNVEFVSKGTCCRAWLYLPDGKTPRPVLVMAHGLGAVREMRLDAFAERFCKAGYAALVFDYRHFGASDGEPRQLLDIASQLEDWEAAISFVRLRSEVDGSKVILWGTSFSGGHVLKTAARVPAIAAVISQCPFTDGLASALVTNPRVIVKLSALAIRDKLGSLLGRRPLMVPLVGKPGSAALMNAPDSEAGYLKLIPNNFVFEKEVAARIALDVTRYFPGRSAAAIPCPVLFCICEMDTLAPAKATLRHARKAPKGEIKLYKQHHFSIYVDPSFQDVVADQIRFLERNVPLSVTNTSRRRKASSV